MVTREDVARRAGVSVSAVSRTMNNRGYVAAEKKAAVLEAARELGYRFNPAVYPVSPVKTRQLCFFSGHLHNSFHIELFDIMSDCAEKRGYTLFLSRMLHGEQAERMKWIHVDGIIVESQQDAETICEIMRETSAVPIVGISFGLPVIHTKNIPYVDVNTYDAMETALKYLRKMGHRKIAFGAYYKDDERISMNSRNIAFKNHMEKVLGEHYKTYVFEGTDIVPEQGGERRNFFFEAGMRAVELFVGENCDATAMICFNDEYALGAIEGFRYRGYKVPEDISVMGFDGIRNRSCLSPGLTTVALNIEEQARRCIDVLIDRIEGKKVKRLTSVKPYLLERGSVKRLECE